MIALECFDHVGVEATTSVTFSCGHIASACDECVAFFGEATCIDWTICVDCNPDVIVIDPN